jgi:ABC-type multidrug transport system fused ATPase/permease subunit
MLQATTNMHNIMAEKVIRSPVVFFDSNPSGRISTRFTKDLTIMDLMFPGITVFVTNSALRIISVAIVVAVIQPWLFLVGGIAAIYIRWCYKTGVGPMIEAQRFDMQFYGPINSILSTTVHGLVTLRSDRKFDHFTS